MSVNSHTRRRLAVAIAMLSTALGLVGAGQATTRFPSAELGLVLRGAPFHAEVGSQVTYLATIRNHGPLDASAVVFWNRLPAGMTLISVTPSQGSCANSTPLRCDLGALPNGGLATVQIVAQATAAGRRVDIGNVTSAERDPRHFDNHASAVTIVGPGHGPGRADLGLILRGAPIRPHVGERVTYVAAIRNHGPAEATMVAFTDRLPAGMTLLSLTASQGGCVAALPIRCDLGSLPSGGLATVQIVAQPTVPGRRVDAGSVTSAERDPRHFNNHAAAITIVSP